MHSTGYVIGNFFGKLKYQHREIVSFYLGRPLSSREAVHHVDGNKVNNNINNLKLMDRSDHATLHLDSKRAKSMSTKGHEARWGYSYV